MSAACGTSGGNVANRRLLATDSPRRRRDHGDKEEKEFTRKTPPPPVILPETNEEEYEVEEILDEKIIRNQPHYLVKWLGYPLHDATWEPLENLKNCQKKLNEFKEKLRQ